MFETLQKMLEKSWERSRVEWKNVFCVNDPETIKKYGIHAVLIYNEGVVGQLY